jgi:hypothetical protein
MRQRLGRFLQSAQCPSKMQLCLGLIGAYRYRTLKARRGLVKLPPLLVDQSQLIMRVGIARIDRRRLQLPPEPSP